jgi:hypothetical protein
LPEAAVSAGRVEVRDMEVASTQLFVIWAS